MTTGIEPDQSADDLLSVAAALRQAAAGSGASRSLGHIVSRLEETLQLFSVSVYTLADDAVPAFAQRRRLDPSVRVAPAAGLSREQEVQVVSMLHDLAGSLSRCAGSCREVSEIVVPLIRRSGIVGDEALIARDGTADAPPTPAASDRGSCAGPSLVIGAARQRTATAG